MNPNPNGRFRLLTTMTAAAAAAILISSTAAAHSTPSHPLLTLGDHGKRVAAVQWLLGGHKPSKFEISTFPYKPNGLYGNRTAHAVVEMKTRLGFPPSALTATAGGDLYDILTGKKPRPLGYLNRATKRLAAGEQIAADHASSACAQKLIAVERAELGVHEIPDGSNDSARIRTYQAVTGAYRAPWCASFQMWALKQARLGFPKTAWSGAIADNSAGVFYIVHWAHDHGWLRAVPKPGYLVAFMDHLGHIGLVERVTHDGYWSIEGNASNQVLERYHPFGARPTVFVRVPGCATG